MFGPLISVATVFDCKHILLRLTAAMHTLSGTVLNIAELQIGTKCRVALLRRCNAAGRAAIKRYRHAAT